MKEVIISEKFNIMAKIEEVGDDLLVVIAGGDAPHIGAVSAGINGPGVGAAKSEAYAGIPKSMLDKGVAKAESAIASVRNITDTDTENSKLVTGKVRTEPNTKAANTVKTYTYPCHKDNYLSEPVAEALTKKLSKNVVVLSGVHIDNLPKEKIKEIQDMVPEMISKIIYEINY